MATTQVQFDPIAELRKKYPNIGMSDDEIFAKLGSPEGFRSAFPEYASVSDADIRKNIAKFGKTRQWEIQGGNAYAGMGKSMLGEAREFGLKALTTFTGLPESQDILGEAKEGVGQLISHPIESTKLLQEATQQGQFARFKEAGTALSEGKIGTAAGKALGGIVALSPGAGEILVSATEDIISGQIGSGLGRVAGLAGQVLTPHAMQALDIKVKPAVANMLRKSASELVTHKIGSVSKETGNVVSETISAAKNYESLNKQIQTKIDTVTPQLDAAAVNASAKGTKIDGSAMVKTFNDAIAKYSVTSTKEAEAIVKILDDQLAGLQVDQSGKPRNILALDPVEALQIKRIMDKTLPANETARAIVQDARKRLSEAFNKGVPEAERLNRQDSGLIGARSAVRARMREDIKGKIERLGHWIFSGAATDIAVGIGLEEVGRYLGLPWQASVGTVLGLRQLFRSVPSVIFRAHIKARLAEILDPSGRGGIPAGLPPAGVAGPGGGVPSAGGQPQGPTPQTPSPTTPPPSAATTPVQKALPAASVAAAPEVIAPTRLPQNTKVVPVVGKEVPFTEGQVVGFDKRAGSYHVKTTEGVVEVPADAVQRKHGTGPEAKKLQAAQRQEKVRSKAASLRPPAEAGKSVSQAVGTEGKTERVSITEATPETYAIAVEEGVRVIEKVYGPEIAKQMRDMALNAKKQGMPSEEILELITSHINDIREAGGGKKPTK